MSVSKSEPTWPAQRPLTSKNRGKVYVSAPARTLARPPGLTTATSTDSAACGVVQKRMVLLSWTKLCACASPSFTTAPYSNPLPVIAPHAPPLVDTVVGPIAAMKGRVGAGCGTGSGVGDVAGVGVRVFDGADGEPPHAAMPTARIRTPAGRFMRTMLVPRSARLRVQQNVETRIAGQRHYPEAAIARSGLWRIVGEEVTVTVAHPEKIVPPGEQPRQAIGAVRVGRRTLDDARGAVTRGRIARKNLQAHAGYRHDPCRRGFGNHSREGVNRRDARDGVRRLR